ncbi:MAG: protein kinase [Leptolyngbyaceae cyanobacterium]
MTHCLNRDCPSPANSDHHHFCQSCGWRLRLGDRFEAVYPLGSGLNSRTFVGRDCTTLANPQCLIKQFAPMGNTARARFQAAERWRHEMDHLAIASRHPQIPELLGCYERSSDQFLVQQFLVGPHLDQQLQVKLGPLTSEEVLTFLKNVLPVLHHLHQNRLIHRDIKPDNFRQPPGQDDWYLVDFGAIKPVTATLAAQPGTLVGSAEYAAPEQLQGMATDASDLYSLGVVCLHLLTGLQPFDLFDSVNSRWHWRSIAPEVTPTLATLIDQMVQPAVHDRLPNVVTAMTQIGLSLPVSRASPIGHRPQHRWQATMMVSLGAVAVDMQSLPAIQQLLILLASGQLVAQSLNSAESPSTTTLPMNGVIAMAPHPHRAAVVTVNRQGQLVCWRWVSPTWQPTSWGTLPTEPTQLQFDRVGRSLWIADTAGSIHRWDGGSGQHRQTWQAHADAITCFALSQASQTLASGDTQGQVKLWDQSGVGLRTLSRQAGRISAIAWLPDEATLAIAGWDVSLRWCWAETGGTYQTVRAQGFHLPVRSLLAPADQPWLVSGSQDGQLQTWSRPQPALLPHVSGEAYAPPVDLGSPLQSLVWLPANTEQGDRLLALTTPGQLTGWQLSN